jgi:hypothetical protein
MPKQPEDEIAARLKGEVDDITEETKIKRQEDERFGSIDTRLSAIESKPEPTFDTSPLEQAIAGIESRLNDITSLLSKPAETPVSAGAETQTQVETPEDDDEIPHVAVSHRSTARVVEERAPSSSHFLFRRLFGR